MISQHPASAWAPRLALLSILAVVVLPGTSDAQSSKGAAEWGTRLWSAGWNRTRNAWDQSRAWYRTAPPLERVSWAGLAVCGLACLSTTLTIAGATRLRTVIPAAFRKRFLERFRVGGIDWSQGVDYCDLNPSPAARLAAAGLRAWNEPNNDIERRMARARNAELARLRAKSKTLRRNAAVASLLGLLGNLAVIERWVAAGAGGAAPGPAFTSLVLPASVGVGLAILALVAYDGLSGRIERLADELDRVADQVIEGLSRENRVMGRRGQTLLRTDPSGRIEPMARPAATAPFPAPAPAD